MTEHKSPIDQLVNLLVYAPVGAAATAQEKLPRLIDKGHERLAGQVATARLFGQFAVAQGRKEAGQLVKQAAGLLSGLGVIPGSPRSESPQPWPGPDATEAQTTAKATKSTSPSSAEVPPTTPTVSAASPPATPRSPSAAAPVTPKPPSAFKPASTPRPATTSMPAQDPAAGAHLPNGRRPSLRQPSVDRNRAASSRRAPVSSEGLAIPGYDSLSASQVVQRLAGLAPVELEAVRVYEAGTRGRRTILSRVAQLQADQRHE